MPTKRYRLGRAPIIEDVPDWFLERLLTYGERPSSAEWQVHFHLDDGAEALGGFAWWQMAYMVHESEVTRARRIRDEVKADILKTWCRQHPGSRPWAWWRFEAPEPRRRVGGQGEQQAGIHDEGAFGLPGYWNEETLDADDPPVFESEASYLERHGLLTTSERGRLKADAFAPVPVRLDDDADDEGDSGRYGDRAPLADRGM
jgi:hypothetical protein